MRTWLKMASLLAAISLALVLSTLIPSQADELAQQPQQLDRRIVIELNETQRHHVLSEMRAFLEATAGVVDGLARDDPDGIAEAALGIARERGQSQLRMRDVLPLEFRQMGRSTRDLFREIEVKASAGANETEIQSLLSRTLNTCNACHSMYQIERSDRATNNANK